MSGIRKQHTARFKFNVAVEALRENKTLNELTSHFSVHQTQISKWKKQLKDHGPSLFENGSGYPKHDQKLIESLYEQIGKQAVEIEWLKKKLLK